MAIEDHWLVVRDALSFVVGAAMAFGEMVKPAHDPLILGLAGALMGVPAVTKRNGGKR